MCEICLKLIVETPEGRQQQHRSGFFIVKGYIILKIDMPMWKVLFVSCFTMHSFLYNVVLSSVEVALSI